MSPSARVFAETTSSSSHVLSDGHLSASSGCDNRTDGNFIIAEGHKCFTYMMKHSRPFRAQTERTVPLAVTKTWTVYDEAEIVWIATHFVKEGAVVCVKEESAVFDTTLAYTTDCGASGFAEVGAYVHDSKFE
jgi:hypothetical protein